MGYFLNKFGISLTSILEAEVDGEDMNKDNDEVEDYSADEGNTNETNKESDGDNEPDQDADETNQEDNDEQTDDQDEDDTTDYTEEGQDDGADNPDESSEGSGDNNDSSDEDSHAVDDIKRQEEELYANMSPEELDIKHKELKMQYINMYDKIEDIIERINNTNVTEINSRIVNYISTTLFNLKKTLTDYLTNVYSMKSYIENSINYNRNLAVLNGIKEILEELAKNEDK